MSQGKDMRSVVLLTSICALVHGLSRIDPLVSIKGGLIRGLLSENGHSIFLGVPYGVVNETNPFGPSLPHPGFDSIFEAYESNECPQISLSGVPSGTLNCLSMNIYVPSIANSQNRLPVMVWIHGGAFIFGSADREGGYSSALLQHEVIVVAINYRLGAYGFMCLDHPEVTGNQGFKDQVLALRWINENIEAFGGNPRQITVFGQSAGGMSINFHLLSSYEKLFQRAIIQSGPALNPTLMVKPDNTIALRLANELGFEKTDLSEALEYLSSIDTRTLTRAAFDLEITSFRLDRNPLTFPCIEKEFEGVENFITEHPRNVVSSKASTTPIIFGFNDNESSYQDDQVNDEFLENYKFSDLLSMDFDFNDDLDDAENAVRHFYVGDEKITENFRTNIADFASDFQFGHPTQRAVEQLLRNGASTVYRYIFSYCGGRNYGKILANLNVTGAVHSDELGYLFDLEIFSGEIDPEDQLVIDRMTKLWTNFAKYGDPTPETSELLPVRWEPVTMTTQPFLNIDSDISFQSRPFHDRMAFWDLFYKVYAANLKWSETTKPETPSLSDEERA